jgi:hypothetical protein
MKILPLVYVGWSLMLFIIPIGSVYGSQERAPYVSAPMVSHTIEGHIVGKGRVVWEESLTPIQEYHLEREYLVLRMSESLKEFMVLEFEPLFISVDQFHLGEKIQAELAADGSLVSAKHIN